MATSAPSQLLQVGAASSVVLMVLLHAAPAVCQDQGVDTTAAARALFLEGLELLDGGQWEEAADRFQRANELRSSPQILYNLTSALVQLGRLVRASELLRQIDRDAEATDQVREAARSRLAEIQARIASLDITLDDSLAGAEVFVDSTPLDPALLGVEAPVDPGQHVISARVAGEVVATREVTLSDGEVAEVRLEALANAEAVTGTADEPTAPQDESRRTRPLVRRWWFWTIIGTVVVSGAITAGVLASRPDEDLPEPIGGLDATVHVGEPP